jgi:hypothetical protein
MDDQRPNRQGGGDVRRNRGGDVVRGFFGTVIVVFCVFVLAFTLYGTWAYWEKPFNRDAGKFEGQGKYSATLSGRVASCLFPGAAAGLLAGVAAGVCIAVLRLTKDNFPTT